MNKNCIYTAIIGDYDVLYEPKKHTLGWDHICITDNKSIKSPFWKVVYIPKVKGSKAKKAREIKILYWHYIKGYDLNIWVDANIQVNCGLNTFTANKKDDFYILQHPERFTVLDEVNFCIAKKKDKAGVLHRQMQDYIADGFPDDAGLCGSGLMIRRDTLQVRALMLQWHNQVKKYSHRDQVSFNYALWKEPMQVNYIPFNLLKCEFIKRPHLKAFEIKKLALKEDISKLLDYFVKENSLNKIEVEYDMFMDYKMTYKI